MHSTGSLITFMTFDDAISAYMLKGKLDSHDIESFIFYEYHITLLPIYSNALGGIKLKINAYNSEKAKSVFREVEDSKVVDEAEKIVKCPRCESESLSGPFRSVKSLKGIIAIVITSWVSMYPFYYFLVYKCNLCGKEFERKQ